MVRQVRGGFPHPSRCCCRIRAGTIAACQSCTCTISGAPGQITRQVGDAFGKKNEALGVVRVTRCVFQINARPVKIARLLDKIDLSASPCASSSHKPACTRCDAHRQVELPIHRRRPGNFSRMPRYSGVTITTSWPALASAAQRAHHVRQPASFRKRIYFAAGEKDSHGFTRQ